MIAAVDVHYTDSGTARAVAMIFTGFDDEKVYRSYKADIEVTEDYIPGQFYRRELPCLIAVLNEIKEEYDTIIIDGYVDPGGAPGLGRHLWHAFSGKKKVIGVAKKNYRNSDAIEVFRGTSHRPLYITAAGIDPVQAADIITNMNGKYRIPDLLKYVDRVSRSEENHLYFLK
jgi:deoxyribonuclease V